MAIKEKGAANRALAYELLENNHLDASANRFYYYCFQKLYNLAEANGYQWESGNSSHTSLIKFTDTLINELTKDNQKKLNVMRARGLTGSFRRLKVYREKADYTQENITASDIEVIKEKIKSFDEQFDILKQNL